MFILVLFDIIIANMYIPTNPDLNGRSCYIISFGSATVLIATEHIVEMDPFCVNSEMATLLGGIENEDLCSFAELQENITSNKQIKLYIYIYFLIFIKT